MAPRRLIPVITAAALGFGRAALASPGPGALAPPAAAGADGPGLVSTLSLLGLGLIFGLKHALDADHIAAVSIVVSRRRSLLSSSLVGVLWGVGHTLALLAAGVLVILLHVEISPRLAHGLEFGVALMLIALGVNALRTLPRSGWHVHPHQHGGRRHVHPHAHDAAPQAAHHHHPIGVRPLLIGLLHGLAGSAALMLLVLSTIPSPGLGFAYIVVFGVGSIGGMLAVSLLLGLPAHFAADRYAGAHTTIRALAALFSLAFGLSLAYQIGVVALT